MLGYKELKRARIALTSGAKEFVQLDTFEAGRLTIADRLRYLGVDPDGAERFARSLIDRDNHALTVVHGPMWRHQLVIVRAAIMAGIAIGIQVERMRQQ